MTQNIEDILRMERRKFAHIHIFFWLVTWLAAVSIFLYCNGWKINPNMSPSTLSVTGSTPNNNVVERFGFILVDTQSNRLSIQVDTDKPVKKDLQKSIPYGDHTISLMGEQGELLNLEVDISAERPFFRRNFTLFHAPIRLSGSTLSNNGKNLINECDRYSETSSGSYYARCAKNLGSWTYGQLANKGNLVVKNNVYTVKQANNAGYVDGSGSLFFPKNYFVSKTYEPLSYVQYPLSDIFSHLGQDFVIDKQGAIVSLGADDLSREVKDQKWAQAKSIGGDIFLVNMSGGLHFYDELYRSREISNVSLKDPQEYLSIIPYEHAYLISTREGSYLYQPYQTSAEKLSDGGVVSIDGEIIDFKKSGAQGQTERIMLSAINPSAK